MAFEKNIKTDKSKYRGFLALFLDTAALLAAGVVALVVIVDPFFQYHKPLPGFPYIIDNQLSQNPGLAVNTEYNAISVGSSVTVNMRISDFKDSFGLDAVKLPYNGAYPKDISNALTLADSSGNGLKAVFWGVDTTSLSAYPDEIKYPLPEYLYDRNPFNDVFYIFNKDVLLDYIIKPFINRSSATDPNEYYCTYQDFTFGPERVLDGFEKKDKVVGANEDYIKESIERIGTNFDLYFDGFFKDHPDTEFYIYFPPRSIYYWYDYRQEGSLKLLSDEEKYFIGGLLEYDNVNVYYFEDDLDIITNFDNYFDRVHFGAETSAEILRRMAEGESRLTKESYEKTVEDFWKLIEEYDYDVYFDRSENTQVD